MREQNNIFYLKYFYDYGVEKLDVVTKVKVACRLEKPDMKLRHGHRACRLATMGRP